MPEIPPVSSNSATSSEELNPLLNPLLEHNLSRWAHVYFTTPPEHRDEAVRQLLRELRSEPGSKVPAESARATASVNSAVPNIACPVCGRDNRAGERFCGFCGGQLQSQPVPSAEQVAPGEQASEEPAGETFSFLGLAPDRSESNADHDIRFLREKSFASSYYEPEEESHRGRIFLVTALLILVGLAYMGLPYLRSHLPTVLHNYRASSKAPVSQPPSPPVQSALPSAAAPAQGTPAAAAPVTGRNTKESSGEQPAEPAAQAKEAPPGPLSDTPGKDEASQSAADSLTLASKAESVAIADNGSRELSQAQRYLDGRGVPHDSTQAVALLWKAVGKQNTHAEVLLADLYMLGDGVAKNCDQARLLLVAASKKGAAEAAEKLHSLESNGCP